MKKLILLVQVCLCMQTICFSQATTHEINNLPAEKKSTVISGKMPTAATDDWLTAAQTQLSKAEYNYKPLGNEFAFVNAKQGLLFGINGLTLITKPIGQESEWNSSIELNLVSKQENRSSVPCSLTVLKKDNYLKYNYNQFEIEYQNNEDGLRQNFIVPVKPEGNDELQVHLTVSGTLRPAVYNKSVLQLIDRQTNRVYLKYDDLKVWDANNKLLAASMELSGDNELIIKVDDAAAVYPVTIDPLTHKAEWTASANGVLPGLLTTLQLQVDAIVGYSVAGVGDVNGDGFDDVAIGAPGAIDVIAGPTTVTGAGAVFLYFGSASGLPLSPSRVLRATTPVANALFGYSIAGGNVAGDAKSDIVVGAPGESYSTAVSGIPSTATVTAGKVYTFRGQDLATGPAVPFATVFLNGSSFFSNGVAGVLLSNVGINALFGFSVGTTGDMNGDGLGEVIVGAPGYAGVQLLDVRSGAAFVYYSTNLATNTPVKLSAPSLIGFPGLVNINGLLFGFSVDGAGDYDKDTRQDVVVGAPGGLNLGLSGFLGGSAYIYTGNAAGTGVNTSIKTQLTSGGPILGSVANLFGYTVKGVKNNTGTRTGNILVGAPVGNVLSEVIGGLNLKTGSINVFPAKASPAATEAPVQTFSSPRAASLLSILSLQPINVNAMFGASIDNMMDANCDGTGDIVVGEPLSTGVGLIGANAVSGAAYVFTGNADGTYNTTPYYTLENTVSFDVGVNAASMIGYSVAGGGHVKGLTKSVRAIIGAPGKSLDFSTGLLSLGNTAGTLFSFAAGDNGLGKAHAFGFNCEVLRNPDVNVTHVNVLVPGNVRTNDFIPAASTYGTPVPVAGNPAGGVLNLNADGTYTFVSPNPGVYRYNVPVCVPDLNCDPSFLTITVLSTTSLTKPPVANTDIAATFSNVSVKINSLDNDAPGNPGSSLVPGSVNITTVPLHGSTTIDATGAVIYSPALDYSGMDTLIYVVSDNTQPVSMSANAHQIIEIRPATDPNTTKAADDFVHTSPGVAIAGNVKSNDTDPEGNIQTVAAQNVTITGKGTLVLNNDGSFVFTPAAGFTGPLSFTYTTCDNGAPQACAAATLYILVTQSGNPDLTPSTRIDNGTFIESTGSTRNLVIEVNEILGNAIDNASVPVQVRLTKSDNFNYTFNPAATTATIPSTIAVDNTDWDLVTNNSSVMIFQLKAGRNMNGFTTSRIFIQMQVLQGAAPGTENQTLRIVDGSGLEINYTNNSVVRILNIVH